MLYPIKAYTKKQLANMYQVCQSTLQKWINNAGITGNNKILTPLEVKCLFEKIGPPTIENT